jgi:hypothetical protein
VDQDDGSVLKVWIVDETGIIGWSDETPEEILVGDLSSGVAPPTDFTQGNN